MIKTFKPKGSLASSHDIRSALGFVDEDIVLSLRDAKATLCELRAAMDELNGDDYGKRKRQRESNGKVSYLYEILRQEWSLPHASRCSC